MIGLEVWHDNSGFCNHKKLAWGCNPYDHDNHKSIILNGSNDNHVYCRHFHGLEGLDVEGGWWKYPLVCKVWVVPIVTGVVLPQHIILIAFALATEVFLWGTLGEIIVVFAQGVFMVSSSIFLVSGIFLSVSSLMLSFFNSLASVLFAEGLVHRMTDLEEFYKVINHHFVVLILLLNKPITMISRGSIEEKQGFLLFSNYQLKISLEVVVQFEENFKASL